jgi:hypothetical protein
MRKGLVTLGVVALVLAVSPGFAEAPILSCLPDVTVTDNDLGGQTADTDMFIFSNALAFDEYVDDADTTDSALRWSGIDPAGTIAINGIMLDNPGVDTLNPGAADLRDVSDMMTISNEAWNAAPPGAGSTTETIIELYVSDATTVTQGSMKITTVDTDGTGANDAVLPATVANYGFDAGAEGWNWFEIAALEIPTHSATGGALQMTENAGHTNIVFGAYESPQDPAAAVMPSLGCVFRARYSISSSGHSTAAQCPGFRLRGATVHVIDAGGGVWAPDFASFDFNSLDQVQYSTLDFAIVSGDFDSRTPGAGQDYFLMLYPRQASEMLLSTDPASPVVHYFSADLLDLEGAVENDQGTLAVGSVVIDAIDRPDIGAGTAVPQLSFATADFASGWTAATKLLPPGPIDDVGLTATANASGLTINVEPGNEFFEAYCEHTAGEVLEPGRTYRVAFTCTSDEQPGGNVGPAVRVNLDSSRFVWNAIKELKGGSLLARLSADPTLMELWAVAPAELGSTPGLTEPMKPKFMSYQGENSTPQWPFQQVVAGTVACTEIVTEVFDW